MNVVISILRFLHDDSIMSNLCASAISFVLGAAVGSRFLRRFFQQAEETHRLLHHVHADAARELGHK